MEKKPYTIAAGILGIVLPSKLLFMFVTLWLCSYCGFQCQTSHWPVHMTSCTQSDAQTEQGRSDQPMELEKDVPTNKEPVR